MAQHYEHYREWLGETLPDLAAFDIEDMNFRLKKLIRVYRELYEYRLAPTEQSYRLLNRAYNTDSNP